VGGFMNWKKFFITFVVVYISGFILSFIIHGLILGSTYEQLSHIWRPDMDRLMWVQYITAIFLSFFFIYIFAKGQEGRGVMEGVRYGLVIWAFYSIPSVYGQYMVYPLPYSLVWKWLLADLVIFVILGIIVALLYKSAESAPKAE
jgi:hypothetical protein